ncbi:MAG: glycosyltransferase [bacterium]|nr:glycosyltransferase [bacterium]
MTNILGRYITAYKNKITNKAFGLVSLHTPENKKGVVLLSFITGPFIQAPGEYFTDPHPNYWTCLEIAKLFLDRGYDVDVTNWDDFRFVPRKKYAVCIDMQYNLERLSRYLPKECKKVMFLVASHPSFQNEAEAKRLRNFEKRRGVTLPAKRTDPMTSDPSVADFILGYGNKTVHGTYEKFGKEILKVPVPAMDIYEFPENKDFNKARKNFLWFGGGGAILKGLDLVVETFASLPHLNLSVVGPSAFEKEFERIYARELSLPNIKRYSRPKIMKDGKIMTDGINILDIFNKCGATVYMSASEGGGGATVHAMQAGIFPIVTRNTGIYEEAPSKVIDEPSIENIAEAVEDFSTLPPKEVKKLSREVWSFARKNHTKEAFSRTFAGFIDNILKL